MFTSRREFLTGCTLGLVAGPLEPQTVDDRLRQLADQAALAMKFPGGSAADCRQWQGRFAVKLRELLGPHKPPAKWETQVRRVVILDDHRREELVLSADGHPPLPLYLLTPRNATAKCAGVLALHGHGNYGYDPVAGRDDLPGVAEAIRGANYDYGRQLARRGYVVAVPCMTPFGVRLGPREAYGNQDPCAVAFVRLQLFGKVLMSENLRDALWAVDFLTRHAQVDATRLAAVGLSYGGRMAMLTAALEPRLQLAVISGALNVMQERVAGRYSCGAQVIPGLLNFGDVPEIASLIAPRHCVWEVGARDGLISPQWADEALTRIRRAYRSFDAEDHLHVDRFEGGHEWSGRVAYSLMEKVLR